MTAPTKSTGFAGRTGHIRSDPSDPPLDLSWLAPAYRQTWAYTLRMFLVCPVWWFYLYWMPKFLKNNHGIDLENVFWPLLVVYLMADVGSIAGGGFLVADPHGVQCQCRP